MLLARGHIAAFHTFLSHSQSFVRIVGMWLLLGILPLPLHAAALGSVQVVPHTAPADIHLPPAWRVCGAFQLRSTHPEVGGWSDMVADPLHGTLWLVSDDAQTLRLHPHWQQGRIQSISATAPMRLPPPAQSAQTMRSRDAEGLTMDRYGRLWIAFEREHRVEGYSPQADGSFHRTHTCPIPPAYITAEDNKGVESLLWDNTQQSLLALREESTTPEENALLRITPLPDGTCNIKPAPYAFPYAFPFQPTALASDIQGQWWLAERRFHWLNGFQAHVSQLLKHDTSSLLLRKETGITWQDNLEGLAWLPNDRGQPVLWLVTDDNAMLWQVSWLLALCPPEQ